MSDARWFEIDAGVHESARTIASELAGEIAAFRLAFDP
jgi:hypothetical protein